MLSKVDDRSSSQICFAGPRRGLNCKHLRIVGWIGGPSHQKIVLHQPIARAAYATISTSTKARIPRFAVDEKQLLELLNLAWPNHFVLGMQMVGNSVDVSTNRDDVCVDFEDCCQDQRRRQFSFFIYQGP